MKSYRSTRDTLAEIRHVLASSKPSFYGETPLEKAAATLYKARHYFWIGIYLVIGDKVVRQTFRGPVAPCHTFEFGKGNVGTAGQTGILKVIPDVSQDKTYSMCFLETKSEIVVPIKIGARVLGVIDAESDEANAFGSEDRVLLKNVAHELAQFLAVRGKYLVRKAEGKFAATQPAGVTKRAAAGESQHR